MMSLATIRDLAQAVAAEAARERRVPYVIEADDLHDDKTLFYALRNIPNLGTYRPKGYKLVKELFVDSSGLGTEGEPALTQRQFMQEVVKNGVGYGYALTECGQFQVYVGVFVKNGRAYRRMPDDNPH